MTAFDFIVTVAMGSAFGRILTAPEVSYTEALITFLLLITLQFVISKLSIKSNRFKSFITSSPRLLYFKGQYIQENLIKECIGKDDIMSAIRFQGFSSIDQVEAVVFESSGSLSVIKKSSNDKKDAFNGLSEINED